MHHGRARRTVSVEPNAEMVERARGQLGLDCASNATVVERALNANLLGRLLDATQQTAGCPSTTASASRTRSCATRAALAPSRLAELPLSVHSGRLTLDLRDARNLAVATLPPIARCAARNSPRGCSDLALLVPGGRGVAPRIAPSNADGVAVGGVAGRLARCWWRRRRQCEPRPGPGLVNGVRHDLVADAPLKGPRARGDGAARRATRCHTGL